MRQFLPNHTAADAPHGISPRHDGASTELVDHRPATRLMTRQQEMMAASPRQAKARALTQWMAPPTAPAAPCQLANWDEWTKPLAGASLQTANLAQVAMLIVDWFQDFNITARVGGSLAAKMAGAKREPVDIDLEIPGDAEACKKAKNFFNRLRAGGKILVDNNLLLVTDMADESGLIRFKCKHVKLAAADMMVGGEPLDAMEEGHNAKFAQIAAALGGVAAVDAKVDFSSESLFTDKDLTPTSTAQDKRGHYGSEYLIASYLNRLASNFGEKIPDPKDDRGQVKAILQKYLAENCIGKSIREMKAAIEEIVAPKTLKHIKETNLRKVLILKILDEIISDAAVDQWLDDYLLMKDERKGILVAPPN